MENKEISSIRVVNGAISGNGAIQELLKKVKKSRQDMNETTKKLNEKEALLRRLREEEKAKREAEEKALKEAEQTQAQATVDETSDETPVSASEIRTPEEPAKTAAPAEQESKADETPAVNNENSQEQPAATTETKRAEEAPVQPKPEVKRPSVVVSADYRPPRQKEYIPSDRNRQQRTGVVGRTAPAAGAQGTRPAARPTGAGPTPFAKGPRPGVKPQEVAFVPKDAPKSGFKKKQDGKK